MRTVWDLLTDPALEARVSRPHRPSHALMMLASDWAMSVTVSPLSASSLGQRFAAGLEQPIATALPLPRPLG